MTEITTTDYFKVPRFVLSGLFFTAAIVTGVTIRTPLVGTWLFLGISVIYYKPNTSIWDRENSLSTYAVAVAILFLLIQIVMLV